MTGPVIHTYARAQALEDGVLFDCGSLAKEAGFKWPVAITERLFRDYLTPAANLLDEGQSFTGRLWDVLSVLRFAIQSSKDDTCLHFSVLFQMSPSTAPVPVELLSAAGPDDEGLPCITIMIPEDY